MGEVDDFLQGLDTATGPMPAASAAAVSGRAVTTSTSWWHTARCLTCGHTFRRGDRVLVDVALHRVWHADPTLACAAPACADAADNARTGKQEAGAGQRRAGVADVHEFSAGLLAAWPVADGIPVVHADDVPGLLDPPAYGFRRLDCLFCAHTFRPGEMVVVCPCSPRCRRCGAAVHRDPAQGLVCFESWRPDSQVPVCPIMLTRSAG
jgi:hypothetical protein